MFKVGDKVITKRPMYLHSERILEMTNLGSTGFIRTIIRDHLFVGDNLYAVSPTEYEHMVFCYAQAELEYCNFNSDGTVKWPKIPSKNSF
jgi:hypothetical protein